MTVKKPADNTEEATGLGLDLEEDEQQQVLASQQRPLLLETVIEQTPHPDGSISVRASTATAHVNGYRDVKIDHYLVPASDAGSVDLSPGSPPPSDDYLSRVEYQVLSPGYELEAVAADHDDDESTVYTSNVRGGSNDSPSIAGSYYARSGRNRRRSSRSTGCVLAVTSVVVFLVFLIGFSFVRDYTRLVPASPGYGGPPTLPPALPPDAADAVINGDGSDAQQHEHNHHHHHHKHGNDTSTLDGPKTE